MKIQSKSYGFSLMEMITVIAIIGFLAGLILASIQGVRNIAKKTKARSNINQLGLALRTYYEEYGRWPNDIVNNNVDTTLTATELSHLVYILSGSNCFLDGPAGSTTGVGCNPKQIRFMEFKSGDLKIVNTTINSGVYKYDTALGTTTNFVDPWNNSYMVKFDWNNDNQITDVFDAPGIQPEVIRGFAIWSAGPDNIIDATETSSSNPAKHQNQDNIFSW